MLPRRSHTFSSIQSIIRSVQNFHCIVDSGPSPRISENPGPTIFCSIPMSTQWKGENPALHSESIHKPGDFRIIHIGRRDSVIVKKLEVHRYLYLGDCSIRRMQTA